MNTCQIVALIFFVFHAYLYAGTTDVFPVNFKIGDQYVRVREIQSNVVIFEKCTIGYEETIPCSFIGRESGYFIDELIDQHQWENVEVVTSTLAAALTFIVSGGTGAYIGGSIGAASGEILSGIGTTLVGGFLGSGIGGTIVTTVNSLNPIEQKRQADVLDAEVIYDRNVEVNDIKTYIDRLELVLSKI